jgi:gamma-glutamyltranspeptidase/glutathione hydrolase
VIAAGHRLTAEAGAEVLRAGGNAIDAAIAALAMACVCEPVLCSPGGGGFATYRRDGEPVSLLDFFPHTPRARAEAADDGVWPVMADFGTAVQEFRIGPATAATPGSFPGIHALASAAGSWTVADLLAPAADAARAGIEVTPFLHFLSTVVEAIVTATDGARAQFAPDGVLRRPGTTLTNPGLADAFDAAASAQPGANLVIDGMVENQRGRGHLCQGDFDAYEVQERSPLVVDVDGARVALNPLPAASGVLIEHSIRTAESTRPVDLARAFADTGRARRAAAGDLSKLAAMPIRRKGTTHISVIDAEGGACAVTTSNGEGNGEIVDGLGFMLNNVLGEDDVNPAGVSAWPTDTRLSSMMSPSLIQTADGGIVALGSGGSNRIRTAIAQVVLRLCVEGQPLSEAIEAPRLHVEGDHLDFEDLFDEADRDELCRVFPDHQAWPDRNLFYGGVHAVAMNAHGELSGVGDPRREGTAIIVD